MIEQADLHNQNSQALALGVARIRPGCQANFPSVVTPSRPDAKLQTLIAEDSRLKQVHAHVKAGNPQKQGDPLTTSKSIDYNPNAPLHSGLWVTGFLR